MVNTVGNHQVRWFATMRKKYGVKTDEEVRQIMREFAKKTSHPGTGGFAYMAKHDPAKLKEISRKAAYKRHGLESSKT